MKNYLLSSLLLVFLIAFAPFITLLSFTPDVSQPSSESAVPLSTGNTVRVLQVSSNRVLTTKITDYLIGSVASEMPASFSEEALKAQAVASYTYLKWILLNSDNASQDLWDISDDSNIHQGFLTTEQMKKHWGDKFDTYYNKIKNVVESVENEYVSYNNEPILALFHGISSGSTANSSDVFENALPYLVSVEAPGDKLSPDLVSTNTFTYNELLSVIGSINEISVEETDKKEWIRVHTTTENGYVKEVKIGNGTISGTELKALLKLKSPNFTITATDSKVEFTVYGKGHGLGMSQYSADFMARQGYTYKEILAHFYPGTELLKD